MKYLAIDLGSTFLKGAVLDLENRSLLATTRIQMPPQETSTPESFFEIAPDSLCNSVSTLIDELLQRAPDAEALMMCAQMHGIVLTNNRGEAASNAITWQDQRGTLPIPGEGGDSYSQWIAKRLPDSLQQVLGGEVRPGIPITTLTWFAQEGNLPSGTLTAVSLPDFVLSQLANETAVVDPTNAASYGLFDLTRGIWSTEAVTLLGLDRFQLPPVVEQEAATPYTISRRGKSLTCHVPAGDHQCALLGSLLRPDELSINVSTGSQVSTLSPGLHFGKCQVRPFFDRLFLHTVTNIPAGRSLNVLTQLLTELPSRAGYPVKNPWEWIHQAIAETEPSNLEVDLWFFGNKETSSAGSIANIREHNLTIGHLFRSAYQSMARDYSVHAKALPAPDEGRNGIVFSGGIAHRSSVLRDLIETRFGVSGRVSPTQEDTLYGLMILALKASGYTDSIAAAADLLRKDLGSS